jgi:hypothetical protein
MPLPPPKRIDLPPNPKAQQTLEEIKTKIMQLREKYPRVGQSTAVVSPYLLVRSYPGDHGVRPATADVTESPDIWVAAGDPATAPPIPAHPLADVTVAGDYTVYAHIWNLGHVPIASVAVEFYWSDPFKPIGDGTATLIGAAHVTLGPRPFAACHQLVKCPAPWSAVVSGVEYVPPGYNGPHKRNLLIVRVTGLGDPLGATPWSPSTNRHVAFRYLTPTVIT